MSTICKLSPNIRQARYRRRAVVRNLRVLLARVTNFWDRVALQSTIKDLEAVRKASWAPHWWKEQAFRSILNRATVK